MITLPHWTRKASTLALASLAIIVIQDWLFHATFSAHGISIGIFAGCVTLVVSMRALPMYRSLGDKILLCSQAILVTSLCVEPSPLSICLMVLALCHSAVIASPSHCKTFWHRWVNVIIAVLSPAIAPLRDLIFIRKYRRTHTVKKTSKIICGWIIPLTITAIFAAIFAKANPIWRQWIEQSVQHLTDFIRNHNVNIDVMRVIAWLITGVSIWSLLRYRRHKHVAAPSPSSLADENAPSDDRAHSPKSRLAISQSTIQRTLVMLVVLFGIQLSLDTRYLALGYELPEAFTCSAYAHRGAYPLLGTALLSGALILIFFRPQAMHLRMRTERILVGLFVAENLLLLCYALWRLAMYVDIYGLSHWRLSAAIWMCLVACGLIWVALRILREQTNLWMLQRIQLTSLVILLLHTFTPSVRIIAYWNTRHCRDLVPSSHIAEVEASNKVFRRSPLDIDYLENLGVEAIPALHWASQQLAKTGKQDKANSANKAAKRLERKLNNQCDNWRSWTPRRYWARLNSSKTLTNKTPQTNK